MARIKYKGRYTYLGTFDTPEEAHAVYCTAAKKLYGKFFNPDTPTVFTIPQFCYRHNINQQQYSRLCLQGRGPVETQLGPGTIRITLEAEIAWQHAVQEPQRALEQRATERAVKAGDAAARSDSHVSSKQRRISGSASVSR